MAQEKKIFDLMPEWMRRKREEWYHESSSYGTKLAQRIKNSCRRHPLRRAIAQK
ncbi:hypothetical protein AgCh_014682, partial [Apium graveolens]